MGIIFIPKYFSQVTALKVCTILGVIFSLGAILTPAHLVFTMPFIDIMTFKSIELVLPVTVLFVALLGLANALVWPAMWPLALNGSGKIHQNRICNAYNGNCRRCTAYPCYMENWLLIFPPRSAYWICVPCIPDNNVLCFYRS